MISIIIPTCQSTNLIPCLESITKYTDLTNVEIIVVANGYDGEIPLGVIPIKFEKMIGYPAAVNAGINQARGQFIVLLNDDTILLEQSRNQWIEVLSAPFSDPKVSITGPWMMNNTEIGRDFICFFCCMIRKSVLDEIGLLDAKAFGFGYSEDVDLCCRAVDAGYKLVQVPTQEKVPYDGKLGIGNFPIYHKGNETFKLHPDPELIHRNHAILRERYGGVIISNAQKLGEWIVDDELWWLGKQATKSKVIIELGSWYGKSSMVMADNLPDDGVIYCIDTWLGSIAERDTNHLDARKMDGDYAYDQFARNLWRHIQSGKLKPIRMHGRHAAKLLKDMGVKADLIFIDAGHTYPEVQEDIRSLLPLMAKGAIICGHDYNQKEVRDAVHSVFEGNVAGVPKTTIWATDCNKDVSHPNIFDCFLFNNELDLLDQRLETLYDTVDRFVIVEAPYTFSGKPKELVFHNNLQRYEKYLNKITYIVVEDLPKFNGSEDSAWTMEQFQREAIMRGLGNCKDNDIIISGDVDEIPNPEAIKSFTGDIASFEMDLYVYDYSVKAIDPWIHCKIARFWKLKEMGVCYARYNAHDTIFPPRIKNGGKHLSYFGGVNTIIEKIHNTPHRNIDTPEFTDPVHIQRCIEEGLDLFKRDIKYEKVCA